jgi:hypothetical protein
MSNVETLNSGSPDAMATLRAVLAEIGWDEWSREEGDNIFVDLDIEDAPIAYAHAAISHKLEQFVFYLVLGLVPSVERRKECALAITDINGDILVGGFDLDFDTGKICFRNGLTFRGTDLRPQEIRNVILDSMLAVETYIDRIAAVIDGQNPLGERRDNIV